MQLKLKRQIRKGSAFFLAATRVELLTMKHSEVHETVLQLGVDLGADKWGRGPINRTGNVDRLSSDVLFFANCGRREDFSGRSRRCVE